MADEKTLKVAGGVGRSNESAEAAAGASETAESTDHTPHNVTPEARRALAEAEERRRQQYQNETGRAREVGGRDGPDPVRYGDWEKGGIASDF